MYDKLLNSFIASFVSCLSAIGIVWYLADEPLDYPIVLDGGASRTEQGHFTQLEVDTLKVRGEIILVDPKTNEPLVKIKDGNIELRNELIADRIGTDHLMGRKIQITTGDPKDKEAPIYSEIGTQADSGAYFALLSPQGTHSINVGFDNNETGFIISQNNDDNSIVAQAIMPIPHAKDAGNAKKTSGTGPAYLPTSVPENSRIQSKAGLNSDRLNSNAGPTRFAHSGSTPSEPEARADSMPPLQTTALPGSTRPF